MTYLYMTGLVCGLIFLIDFYLFLNVLVYVGFFVLFLFLFFNGRG